MHQVRIHNGMYLSAPTPLMCALRSDTSEAHRGHTRVYSSGVRAYADLRHICISIAGSRPAYFGRYSMAHCLLEIL